LFFLAFSHLRQKKAKVEHPSRIKVSEVSGFPFPDARARALAFHFAQAIVPYTGAEGQP
jgi:hypothetical protein